MKKTLLTLTAAATLLIPGFADNALTRNRELKSELARERKALEAAREKNRAERNSIITLEQTIARVEGTTPAPATVPAARLLFANSFQENFNGFGKNPAECDAAIVEIGGAKALRLVSPDGKMACIQRGFAVPEGSTIQLTVKMKAENVVRLKPLAHTGTKFMLMVTRDGKTIWPEVMPQQGSFDWTEQRFRQEIPFGVKNVVLMLGLQGATGTVYFKDLKVEVLEK